MTKKTKETKPRKARESTKKTKEATSAPKRSPKKTAAVEKAAQDEGAHGNALPAEYRRDFRGNLLLDDAEEAVFKRTLKELSRREGRRVYSTELLRRLVMPFLRRQAERYGMSLTPPRPTDLIPVRFDDREGASDSQTIIHRARALA